MYVIEELQDKKCVFISSKPLEFEQFQGFYLVWSKIQGGQKVLVKNLQTIEISTQKSIKSFVKTNFVAERVSRQWMISPRTQIQRVMGPDFFRIFHPIASVGTAWAHFSGAMEDESNIFLCPCAVFYIAWVKNFWKRAFFMCPIRSSELCWVKTLVFTWAQGASSMSFG